MAITPIIQQIINEITIALRNDEGETRIKHLNNTLLGLLQDDKEVNKMEITYPGWSKTEWLNIVKEKEVVKEPKQETKSESKVVSKPGVDPKRKKATQKVSTK